MYSKGGDLGTASTLFNKLAKRTPDDPLDTTAWTAMIAALGQHGKGVYITY